MSRPTDRDTLERVLATRVTEMQPLAGGDVADAYAVHTIDGDRVFAKTHRRPPPGFFTTEATGLEWLRHTETVSVPEVLAASDDPPWLVLAWIDETREPPDEQRLGRELALLHGCTGTAHGRPDRRTTGSRGLPNEPTGTWHEFYAQNRLLPLARLARDTSALPSETVTDLELLAHRLGDMGLPEEGPRLVHGDLWGGNRLVGRDGQSWLIDPAAHWSSREFDLAMMRLFGGFGADVFDAYQEALPLPDGWADRVALHQIAPLVVHAIKFGGGYVAAAARAIATSG